MWNWRSTWVVIGLLLLVRGVCAQGVLLPGAGGFADGGQSHAWVVLPLGSHALLHLPPRSGNGPVGLVEPGSTRLAAPLHEAAEMAAAWENRVYLAFAATPVPPDRLVRRVLSLGAHAGPMGSVWSFDNYGGRMEVLAALPGDGDLISFVGSARGPVALLRRDTGEVELLRVEGTVWGRVNLPDGDLEKPRLVALPQGVGLLSWEREKARLWTAVSRDSAEPTTTDKPLPPLVMEWTVKDLSLRTEGGELAPQPDGPVFQIGQVLVYSARSSAGAVEIWNPTPSRVYRLAVLPEVGAPYAAAPLDDVGRLALVWPRVEGTGGGRKAPGTGVLSSPSVLDVSIVEISVVDGAVIYAGPALQKGPVSPEELKLLAVALVGVMALILLFVLKPEESRGPVHLPKGVTLAEPGRRMFAGLLDLLLAATIASALTGRGLLELLLLSGVFTEASAMLGVLSMLGIGFVLSVIGETLFGRSAGKALTGCAVAWPRMVEMPDKEMVPALARPTLWRAVVRNLVKWFVPPIAIMGLSGPEFRHRGDVAAGTVVVVEAKGSGG
jgi:hypothetical protein